MNKRELIQRVSETTGMSIKTSTAAVAAMLETLATALMENKKVRLVHFGNFEVHERASRVGQDPKTRSEILIKACRVPVFKPSAVLKQRVNGKLP